jgi:hypothetical protein
MKRHQKQLRGKPTVVDVATELRASVWTHSALVNGYGSEFPILAPDPMPAAGNVGTAAPMILDGSAPRCRL